MRLIRFDPPLLGTLRSIRCTLGRAVLVSLVLLAVVAPALAQTEPQATTEADAGESEPAPVKRIKMTAENWKWTPKVIRVAVGTRLRIEFQSYDAPHSFVLKAYGLKVALPEGETAEVEFVVDTAGTFKWKCGRPCGNGCAKMTGKLIVE